MSNKQLFTVAIVSLLCCAAVQVDGAKPTKGGGGNHMQRGIELAQQKHFDAAAEEFGKAIEQIRKILADMQIAAPPIARERELRWQREIRKGHRPDINLPWRIFQKLSSCPQRMPPCIRNAVETQIELKQYDAALADLNKALELKPDDLTTIKFRGFAEIGFNQWDKAVADFSAVIQKKPDDLQSYDRRALAYRSLKNYDASIADYTFLITKNPNDLEALTKRGYTYSLAQQYENAIADYQAELKVNPQDNDTFQRLQYAQSMLAAKNASPSPTPPIASPTPEEKRLMDKISPLYIGIGVVALLVIAVIVRLVTRGKAEPTSHRIR